MIEKKFEQDIKDEIILWEDNSWKEFQKNLESIQKKIKWEGLELYWGRYWINSHEKGYNEHEQRIDFLEGYHCYCQYAIKKNGKIFYDEDLEWYTMRIHENIKIKYKKFPFLSKCLNVFHKMPLYVEMQEFGEEFFKGIEEDILFDLEVIKKGREAFDD